MSLDKLGEELCVFIRNDKYQCNTLKYTKERHEKTRPHSIYKDAEEME
jgi:hypothetical protein